MTTSERASDFARQAPTVARSSPGTIGNVAAANYSPTQQQSLASQAEVAHWGRGAIRKMDLLGEDGQRKTWDSLTLVQQSALRAQGYTPPVRNRFFRAAKKAFMNNPLAWGVKGAFKLVVEEEKLRTRYQRANIAMQDAAVRDGKSGFQLDPVELPGPVGQFVSGIAGAVEAFLPQSFSPSTWRQYWKLVGEEDGEGAYLPSAVSEVDELIGVDASHIAQELAERIDHRGLRGDDLNVAAHEWISDLVADGEIEIDEANSMIENITSVIGDQDFIDSVDRFTKSRMSVGRKVANDAGIDPDSTAYTAISGAFDTANAFIDIFYGAGKVTKARRVMKYGVFNQTDVIRKSLKPEVWREISEIAGEDIGRLRGEIAVRANRGEEIFTGTSGRAYGRIADAVREDMEALVKLHNDKIDGVVRNPGFYDPLFDSKTRGVNKLRIENPKWAKVANRIKKEFFDKGSVEDVSGYAVASDNVGIDASETMWDNLSSEMGLKAGKHEEVLKEAGFVKTPLAGDDVGLEVFLSEARLDPRDWEWAIREGGFPRERLEAGDYFKEAGVIVHRAEDGKVNGVLAFSISEIKTYNTVSAVAVEPGARGQGIATKMLDSMQAHADEMGVDLTEIYDGATKSVTPRGAGLADALAKRQGLQEGGSLRVPQGVRIDPDTRKMEIVDDITDAKVFDWFADSAGTNSIIRGEIAGHLRHVPVVPFISKAHLPFLKTKQFMASGIDWLSDTPLRVMEKAKESGKISDDVYEEMLSEGTRFDFGKTRASKKKTTSELGIGRSLWAGAASTAGRVAKYATTHAPDNVVDLRDPDSGATIRNLATGFLTTRQADNFMELYEASTNVGQRQILIRGLYDTIFEELGVLETEAGREFAQRFIGSTMETVGKQMGFDGQIYGLGDHAFVTINGRRVPGAVFTAETAGQMAVPDIRKLYGHVKRAVFYKRMFGYDVFNNNAVDYMMGGLWTRAVLMRPGFALRAGGEEALQFAMREGFRPWMKARLAANAMSNKPLLNPLWRGIDFFVGAIDRMAPTDDPTILKRAWDHRHPEKLFGYFAGLATRKNLEGGIGAWTGGVLQSTGKAVGAVVNAPKKIRMLATDDYIKAGVLLGHHSPRVLRRRMNEVMAADDMSGFKWIDSLSEEGQQRLINSGIDYDLLADQPDAWWKKKIFNGRHAILDAEGVEGRNDIWYHQYRHRMGLIAHSPEGAVAARIMNKYWANTDGAKEGLAFIDEAAAKREFAIEFAEEISLDMSMTEKIFHDMMIANSDEAVGIASGVGKITPEGRLRLQDEGEDMPLDLEMIRKEPDTREAMLRHVAEKQWEGIKERAFAVTAKDEPVYPIPGVLDTLSEGRLPEIEELQAFHGRPDVEKIVWDLDLDAAARLSPEDRDYIARGLEEGGLEQGQARFQRIVDRDWDAGDDRGVEILEEIRGDLFKEAGTIVEETAKLPRFTWGPETEEVKVNLTEVMFRKPFELLSEMIDYISRTPQLIHHLAEGMKISEGTWASTPELKRVHDKLLDMKFSDGGEVLSAKSVLDWIRGVEADFFEIKKGNVDAIRHYYSSIPVSVIDDQGVVVDGAEGALTVINRTLIKDRFDNSLYSNSEDLVGAAYRNGVDIDADELAEWFVEGGVERLEEFEVLSKTLTRLSADEGGEGLVELAEVQALILMRGPAKGETDIAIDELIARIGNDSDAYLMNHPELSGGGREFLNSIQEAGDGVFFKENGHTQLQHAKQILDSVAEREEDIFVQAFEYAVNRITPHIDNVPVRSFLATYGRNIMPFWWAEERFYKRTAQTLFHSPESLMRMHILYKGAQHAGFIHTDERGEDYFVYPGVDMVHDTVTKTLNFVTGGDYHTFEKVDENGQVIDNFTDYIEVRGKMRLTMPGVDPEQMLKWSPSPMMTVPIRLISNAFPELGFLNSVAGEYGGSENIDIWETVIPPVITRLLKVPNATEHYASAQHEAMKVLVANGFDPEVATPEEIESFNENLHELTQTIAMMRVVYGFAGMAPPEINFGDLEGKSAELWQFTQSYGFSEGIRRWTEKNPTLSAYEVGSNFSPTGRSVPATTASLQWMDTNSDFIKDHTYAAAYLYPIPEQFGESEFLMAAWNKQMILGLKDRRESEELYRAVKFADAAPEYFKNKERAEGLMEELKGTPQRAEVQERWRQWKEGYFKRHPIFREELVSQDRRNRRLRVLEDIRLAADDPNLPADANVTAALRVVDTYDRYKEARSQYIRSTKNDVAAREALRNQFLGWMQRVVDHDSRLLPLYQTVILPEMNLDQDDVIELIGA